MTEQFKLIYNVDLSKYLCYWSDQNRGLSRQYKVFIKCLRRKFHNRFLIELKQKGQKGDEHYKNQNDQ